MDINNYFSRGVERKLNIVNEVISLICSTWHYYPDIRKFEKKGQYGVTG